MAEFLEFQVDKFIFRVAKDRWYNREGVWLKREGQYAQIGISDYLQQRSGDVAFAEIKPEGTLVKKGEEIAVIETIKVNISLPSPISGKVNSVNKALADTPEIVNQDPYGEGWLATIVISDFSVQVGRLLDAQTYLVKIKAEAEQETGN